MRKMFVHGVVLSMLAVPSFSACCTDRVSHCTPPADASVQEEDTGLEQDASWSDAEAVGDAYVDAEPDTDAEVDGEAQDCPDGFGGPPADTEPPIAGNWRLQFQEDFLGDHVDGSRWKFGAHFFGFNGIAGNDPANTEVRCGYLHITAEKRDIDYGGELRHYVAAELSTFKRFRQAYGYFEARIRYDAVVGVWPAFWLMPDRGQYGRVDKNRSSLLKFDLSDVAATSVDEARLVLHVEEAGDCLQVLTVLPVHDDSWNETTVTGDDHPVFDPAWVDVAYDPQWRAGDTVFLDVTRLVDDALSSDKIVSLALADGFERDCRLVFASKEAAVADQRPRIELSSGLGSVPVFEDSTLGEGASSGQNFGTEPTLSVVEAWAATASTKNGGMEFDIMESLGHWGPDMTAHTVHWDGYGSQHKSASSGHFSFPATSDGFHVYGMSWQPGELRFFVDGQETWTWANARVGTVPAFVLLSFQMGGWGDDLGDNRVPDDSALPARMDVDYVRVWSGEPQD